MSSAHSARVRVCGRLIWRFVLDFAAYPMCCALWPEASRCPKRGEAWLDGCADCAKMDSRRCKLAEKDCFGVACLRVPRLHIGAPPPQRNGRRSSTR